MPDLQGADICPGNEDSHWTGRCGMCSALRVQRCLQQRLAVISRGWVDKQTEQAG